MRADDGTAGRPELVGRARREPATSRGERTRAALVAAAQRVFERDGYIESRLVDITREAHCSTATFYTYFSGKDAILEAVVAEVEDDMLHPGSRRPPGDRPDAVELIRAGNRAYFEAYRRNAPQMKWLEQAAVFDPTFQRVRRQRSHRFIERNARAIAQLQADGRADPGLDPALAARALSAMVSRLAYATYVLEDPVPLDDLVDVATRLWVHGLALRSDPAPDQRPGQAQ